MGACSRHLFAQQRIREISTSGCGFKVANVPFAALVFINSWSFFNVSDEKSRGVADAVCGTGCVGAAVVVEGPVAVAVVGA